MVDALKRASAKRITVVMPFYGYARQDKKHRGREPISARLMADLFKTAGADRLITVDLHADQIQGFFDGPVDHLMALPILADYVKEKYGDQPLAVVSPDAGRIKVAERWSARLGGAPLAFIHKSRRTDRPNETVANRVVGDVTGRMCVLVDDMIDTGGTIVKAAEALMDDGAAGVIIAATHAILSDPAVDRLKNSPGRRGRRHQHAAAHRRPRVRQAHLPVDRAAGRARDPRGLRGRLGHLDVRRARLVRSRSLTGSRHPPITGSQARRDRSLDHRRPVASTRRPRRRRGAVRPATAQPARRRSNGQRGRSTSAVAHRACAKAWPAGGPATAGPSREVALDVRRHQVGLLRRPEPAHRARRSSGCRRPGRRRAAQAAALAARVGRAASAAAAPSSASVPGSRSRSASIASASSAPSSASRCTTRQRSVGGSGRSPTASGSSSQPRERRRRRGLGRRRRPRRPAASSGEVACSRPVPQRRGERVETRPGAVGGEPQRQTTRPRVRSSTAPTIAGSLRSPGRCRSTRSRKSPGRELRGAAPVEDACVHSTARTRSSSIRQSPPSTAASDARRRARSGRTSRRARWARRPGRRTPAAAPARRRGRRARLPTSTQSSSYAVTRTRCGRIPSRCSTGTSPSRSTRSVSKPVLRSQASTQARTSRSDASSRASTKSARVALAKRCRVR